MIPSAPTIRLLAPGVALLLLASCLENRGTEDFVIVNETSEEITITLLGEENVTTTAVQGDNGSFFIGEGCRGTGLVATTADGREVARLDQTLCAGQVLTVNHDLTVELD